MEVCADDFLPFIDVGSKSEKAKDVRHGEVAVLSGGCSPEVRYVAMVFQMLLQSFGGVQSRYPPWAPAASVSAQPFAVV